MRIDQTIPNSNWLNPSDYGKSLQGIWYCKPKEGLLGNLSAHIITEYPDGTITVEPSILITSHDNSWHGYIRNGKWEELH